MPSFYRFINQTRDPLEMLNDRRDDENDRNNDESKIDTRDLQPEMFYHIN